MEDKGSQCFPKGNGKRCDHFDCIKDHSGLCMDMILAASKNKPREMVGPWHRSLVVEVMRSG